MVSATNQNYHSASAVIEIAPKRKLKNVTTVEHLPNRRLIKERYGIAPKTLTRWVKELEINPPGNGGLFCVKDVELLDDYWLAKKILHYSTDEFCNWVIVQKQSLELVCEERQGFSLFDLISRHSAYKDHPIVKAKLERLAQTNNLTEEQNDG
ncbi:MAG: hypothetical protein WBB28_20850 [Crinalium sp.]